MSKIIGSIIYSNNSGLGILARDFYNHGLIHKVVIQNIPGKQTIDGRFKREDIYLQKDFNQFLDNIDVLFLLESYLPTVYEWNNLVQIHILRQYNIKLVLMPMYECTHPQYYSRVNHIIVPSLIGKEIAAQHNNGVPIDFIPIPVEKPWTLHTRGLRFIHNAGTAANNRNGTLDIIKAMPLVKNPLCLEIRLQNIDSDLAKQVIDYAKHDCRVKVRLGEIAEDQLYDGDVFVFPEKYCGCSLPLQEAFASGMAIIAGNRFPMNTWLPPDGLVDGEPADDPKVINDLYSRYYKASDLAQKIDTFYAKDITELSLCGKKWAEHNSWTKLKPLYESILLQ
jgi:hypothetical protein